MELTPNLIKGSIEELLTDTDLPDELKTFGSNILRLKKGKNHYSVFFVNTLLFRVVEKKTIIRFEFRYTYKEFFDDTISRDKQGWIIVEKADPTEMKEYKSELLKIIDFEFNRVQGEAFGCCSHYMECSDKKQCVKTDFLLSLACLYRINLLQNKIFYGINRNV